jgi:MFS family permease
VAFYEPKIFYVTSMLVFEVGSIICATSPNSPVFILGRAVAGLGAAGMTAGGFAIIGHTPMRERPRLMAFFTALQAVAYTSGPTMSGALTDSYLTVRPRTNLQCPLGGWALPVGSPLLVLPARELLIGYYPRVYILPHVHLVHTMITPT